MLTFLLCSFVMFQNQNITNIKSEFSKTCLKLSSEFKTVNQHGLIYNDKTKKHISLQEFSKILKTVSEYDLNQNLKYDVDSIENRKIKRIIWKAISKKDKIISIEKLTFKTIIEHQYDKKKYTNEFTIVDYSIKRNVAPKNIYLRVMENEFEKLSIENINYSGVFESRLLGIDYAEVELDKLLNKK